MRIYSLLCVLFSTLYSSPSAQAQIQLEFTHKTNLKADKFIGVDEFDATYYILNNTLFKETEDTIVSFQQNHLGEISSVDIRNPLKILVFYRDYNTVILLDNKLNPLGDPINFSTLEVSQNIGLVNLALDHQLWLYTIDDNRLHLWDYQTKKITYSSKPLSFLKKSTFHPTQQLATFTDTYLTDQKGFLKFNKYAQFESSINFNEFNKIVRIEDDFIYLKNNQLYFQTLTKPASNVTLKPHVKVKDLFYLHDHLHIFDGESIFTYKITKI
ncbi:hypothetical protein MWU59_01495 [Flavobacteriaceae bacterium F08102]|nr:hypothetical protein [Flavobacteriaceae bacterium F08102]